MIIIKYYDLYVPLNQNANSFRHYGIKFDKILFFELHELFHIFSSEIKKDYPPYIKAYFEMKIRYNLLRNNDDMSLIVPLNRYLYNEMLCNNKYYIDKFIIKNSAVIEWEILLKTAHDKLSSKEISLFETLSTKLLKHASFFEKLSNIDIEKSNIISIPTTSNVEHTNTYTLFDITEEFNNFNISFPNIDNTLQYLKSPSKVNPDINLLDYLKFSVYHCKSNFSRIKDKPLTEILFINKYVKLKELLCNLKDKVVCVISNNEYVILNIKEIIIYLSTTDQHIKKRKL